ncbi:MAG: transposase [Candidatus Nealsonbacteria bacterium]|nr:transposase [Candidatus Nealsonbacteria bacterium]
MYRYNFERRHGGIGYLTPKQKLLKLELRISSEENSKARSDKPQRSAESRTVNQSTTINSNQFVAKVVG